MEDVSRVIRCVLPSILGTRIGRLRGYSRCSLLSGGYVPGLEHLPTDSTTAVLLETTKEKSCISTWTERKLYVAEHTFLRSLLISCHGHSGATIASDTPLKSCSFPRFHQTAICIDKGGLYGYIGHYSSDPSEFHVSASSDSGNKLLLGPLPAFAASTDF